jgi:hypothetical protein
LAAYLRHRKHRSVTQASRRMVAPRDRLGVRADDGRCAAGQSQRRSCCGAHRRSRDHRRRGGFRLSIAFGGPAWLELLANVRPIDCGRRRPGPAGAPLTSTLLGSVEKPRSGVAAGVLNSTRQTGSVLGVALFGSLAGGKTLLRREQALDSAIAPPHRLPTSAVPETSRRESGLAARWRRLGL